MDLQVYFSLLRVALDVSGEPRLERSLTDKEWAWVFGQSVKQSLVGLMYSAIEKLPAEQRPPREMILRWSFKAHQIQLMNDRLNRVASRLTQTFESHGVQSLILKGPANARLYPDPTVRQPGDIDILIGGGRGGVRRTLEKAGLQMDPGEGFSNHHVKLDSSQFENVTIEVHFTPTSGFSPFNTRRMLEFLEAQKNPVLVPEGFYVPGIPFALVMQLSHLRQHFFSTGIGLRQLVDYHQLLQHSTAEEREQVGSVLKALGLYRMAGAVMWVMQQVFGLDPERMLCPVDSRRGNLLLNVVMNGGNFGHHADDYNVPVFTRWQIDRKRFLKMLKFDKSDAVWHELLYWKHTLSLIPRRIRRGRIALGKR